jgi:hypothetical protein
LEDKISFPADGAYLSGKESYGADCTVFKVHGGVATPWNGLTIPRRCALPCALKTAHSTPFNCRL